MKTKIDFLPATHTLQDMLYRVDVQEASFKNSGSSLTDYEKKVIVNLDEGKIISLVSHKYRFISNESAVELGKVLFRQIFSQTKTDDLIPFKVIAPPSKFFCYIDLVDTHVDFTTWEQETWLPFLRVSNSYDYSHVLSYEIGFVRKLCANGCLFQKDVMKLKYRHAKDKKIILTNDVKALLNTRELFKEQCNILRHYYFPIDCMVPLIVEVLKIPIPRNVKLVSTFSNFYKLIEETKHVSGYYFDTMGQNAYAAFNVMTDLVSHQDEYKNITDFSQNASSFYTKPSMWMEDLISRKPQDIWEYLGETIDRLNDLKKKTGFKWELN